MLKSITTGLAMLGLAITLPTAAMAEDGETPEATEDGSSGIKCIEIWRLKTSRVVDNETIILELRGGPDYKMNLANRCPGLKMQGTWRHDVRGHTKLCSIDIIRVPMTTSGGLAGTSWTSCIIESFEEYDEAAEKAEEDNSDS